MFLINALYFNGIWKYEFDEKQTQKQTFYKEDGTTVMADMMSQTCISGYYKDEHLELTTLNYGEDIFSMIFVLPNPNATFDAVLNQLAKPDYFENSIREALQPYFEVDLFIPKFKIEYEKTLNGILKELNMNLAFSDFADFSNISDIGVHISTVFQKAYIDVNEKGTEAAAVTSVVFETTSEAPSIPKVIFRADRPFLFAIRENSTGTILFMGKVGNPVN
jgi:serpin B